MSDDMVLVSRAELAQMRSDLKLLGWVIDAVLVRMRGHAMNTWPALHEVLRRFDARFPKGTQHGNIF